MKSTDIDRYSLRGQVKQCEEESTYPAVPAEGGSVPERKVRSILEFDVRGNLTASKQVGPSGDESSINYSYDPRGRLLNTKMGMLNQKPVETTYEYDGQGRLLRITRSDKPQSPVEFHYDDRGRKSKIQVSRAEDYQGNLASGGSPFEAADGAPPNLSTGGTATTLYDEQDRPYEVQVRNSAGEIVSRAVRTYDAQGHAIEEKNILEKPSSLIPDEAYEKISAQSGAPLNEVRAQIQTQLATFLGGNGMHSERYEYDGKGNLTRIRRSVFGEDETIEITYNHHGDKETEITRRSAKKGEELPQPFMYSEARFDYTYDERGNWTESSVAHRSDPNGEFLTSFHRRRTLTYY